MGIFNKSTESLSLYYSAAVPGTIARGKLYDAYNYKRATLAKAGIISRRIRGPSKKITQANKKSKICKRKKKTSKANGKILEKNLHMLKTRTEPWSEILHHWRLTHNYRKEMLNGKIRVSLYMDQYLSFAAPNGFELVNTLMRLTVI